MLPGPQHIEDIERRTLQMLCALPCGEESAAYARSLSDYAWRDAEHHIVYQALLRVGFLPPAARRRELPAETTRMGFPDIDCTTYWDGEAAGIEELPELVRTLCKSRAG